MKTMTPPPPVVKVVFFIPLGDSYFDAINEASSALDFSIFVDLVPLCPNLFGCTNFSVPGRRGGRGE